MAVRRAATIVALCCVCAVGCQRWPCINGTREGGRVRIELLERYDEGSSYALEPRFFSPDPSCNGADGLDAGSSLDVRFGRAYGLVQACGVLYEMTPILEGAPLEGSWLDNRVQGVPPTLMEASVFGTTRSVAGCRGHWSLGIRGQTNDLLEEPRPGAVPPWYVARRFFPEGGAACEAVFGTLEYCTDVWVARFDILE